MVMSDRLSNLYARTGLCGATSMLVQDCEFGATMYPLGASDVMWMEWNDESKMRVAYEDRRKRRTRPQMGSSTNVLSSANR